MKSEFKFWRWAAVIGVLILGIVGSIAVAAPKGGGGGSELQQLGRPPPGCGRHPLRAAWAGKAPFGPGKGLGVTTAKLREALEAVHDDLGPPEPGQWSKAQQGRHREALHGADRRAREGARQER